MGWREWGSLLKHHLFLPTLIEMGWDHISVLTALSWLQVTSGSDLTGVFFPLAEKRLVGPWLQSDLAMVLRPRDLASTDLLCVHLKLPSASTLTC